MQAVDLSVIRTVVTSVCAKLLLTDTSNLLIFHRRRAGGAGADRQAGDDIVLSADALLAVTKLQGFDWKCGWRFIGRHIHHRTPQLFFPDVCMSAEEVELVRELARSSDGREGHLLEQYNVHFRDYRTGHHVWRWVYFDESGGGDLPANPQPTPKEREVTTARAVDSEDMSGSGVLCSFQQLLEDNVAGAGNTMTDLLNLVAAKNPELLNAVLADSSHLLCSFYRSR